MRTTAKGVADVAGQQTHRLKLLALFCGVTLFLLAAPASGLCAKRVGIVYSETSANLYWDKFAYSQLFMAMQHQAVMAGIPFDLLNENDLITTPHLLNYSALILLPMQYTANEASVLTALRSASQGGVGIITAGVLISTQFMEELLGVRYTGWAGGVPATVTAADITHPIMRGYSAGELISQYSQIWFNFFEPIDNGTSTVLANFNAENQVRNAAIATVTGGRNVFLANDQVMGDTNLVWAALQWVVYGAQTAVSLKPGRHSSIFIGRNDMDSSMYAEELAQTDIALLPLLKQWKQSYNFVGSYYINIGNTPNNGEYTDWTVSKPLYLDYIRYGNEIGTHSYTHPDYTGQLTSSELEFEFNQSMLEIEAQLGIEVTGAAIPGNPETLEVDQQLNAYLEYVSGRASFIGSGYPGAFGYLSPDYDMFYFSLNLSPDYTLIVWQGHTPAEASQIWQNEYNGLITHASQPIMHWLWHDYGPTSGASGPYSLAMYENLLATAFNGGSEFATADDIQKRIRALQSASLEVEESGALIADVTAADVGQFSLGITSSQVISRVDDWYAYDEDQVFIPQNGGRFVIRQGASQTELTRIVALPMRAKLISLSGDGTELSFTFEGEGAVQVELNPAVAESIDAQGADSFTQTGTRLTMHFNDMGEHTASIRLASTANHAPNAAAQTLTVEADTPLVIALTASDPDNDPLTLQITAEPSNGALSGTLPNLTYTPNAGFSGSDSFDFIASDGALNSAPATVNITVTAANQPPTANAQSLTTAADTPLTIALTASDPDNDPLTLQITSEPSNGTLSGTPPNLTYTPNAGFSGNDTFSFSAGDGVLTSSPATVAIAVTTAAGAASGSSNYTGDITIDGDLAEWAALTSFGPDPDDIVEGTGTLIDWREAWMAHDDGNFYLAIRNDSAIALSWAYNIYLDTDSSSATGFHNGSAFPVGAEFLVQGGHLYQYAGDGSSWNWTFVVTLPQAVNGATAEFSVSRADIGNPDHLRLFFYGDNSAYSSEAGLDLYPDQALDPQGSARFFTYATVAD